jgi:hypothetical protein
MTQPNEPFASESARAQRAFGRWSYFVLFGMQTIGAVVLFWTGLFLYRQVLADPSHEPELWPIVGSLSSIALMQICYWVSYRVRPPLPQFQNALLGHVILFLARMVYVLPTAVFQLLFSALCLSRRGQNSRSPSSGVSSFFWVCSPCSATCGSWSAWVGFSPAKKASTGAGPKMKALEGKRLALI